MDKLMKNCIDCKDYDSYNSNKVLCTNSCFQECNYQYHTFVNKDMSLIYYLFLYKQRVMIKRLYCLCKGLDRMLTITLKFLYLIFLLLYRDCETSFY